MYRAVRYLHEMMDQVFVVVMPVTRESLVEEGWGIVGGAGKLME